MSYSERAVCSNTPDWLMFSVTPCDQCASPSCRRPRTEPGLGPRSPGSATLAAGLLGHGPMDRRKRRAGAAPGTITSHQTTTGGRPVVSALRRLADSSVIGTTNLSMTYHEHPQHLDLTSLAATPVAAMRPARAGTAFGVPQAVDGSDVYVLNLDSVGLGQVLLPEPVADEAARLGVGQVLARSVPEQLRVAQVERPPRYCVRLPIRYRRVTDTRWHLGVTENISRTGILFRTELPGRKQTLAQDHAGGGPRGAIARWPWLRHTGHASRDFGS